MASEPQIVTFDAPDSSPPGNTISVDINIGNNNKDPLPQSGTCLSGILGHVAWNNPWELFLDGEKVAEGNICTDRPDGNPNKEVTERVTLKNSTGEQRLRLVVLKVPEMTIHDEQIKIVNVSTSAEDPAVEDPGAVREFFENIASQLGTSVNMLALGAVLAAAVFILI